MEKDAYYFSHDSNSRGDFKIKALIRKYGYEGYGWYWAFVEMMREQKDYKIPYNKEYLEIYADDLKTNVKTINTFIQDCANNFNVNGCGLFKLNEKFIWSMSLLRRMARLEDYRKRQSKAGKLGAERRWGSHSNPIAIKDSKVKDSKVKKDNRISYAPYVQMLKEEYQDLCKRFGKKRINGYIERISDYQKGRGGQKYKDIPATIKNWMRRDTGVSTVKDLEIKAEVKVFCPKCNIDVTNQVKNTTNRSCNNCGANLSREEFK